MLTHRAKARSKCVTKPSFELTLSATDIYLIVNDETNWRWEGNGSDATQKIPQFLAHFESTVTRDWPQQTVDEVLAHVALQLVTLWTFLRLTIISIISTLLVVSLTSISNPSLRLSASLLTCSFGNVCQYSSIKTINIFPKSLTLNGSKGSYFHRKHREVALWFRVRLSTQLRKIFAAWLDCLY